MIESEVNIPEEWAGNILSALDVCFGEGIGPHGESLDEMVAWIFSKYPALAKEYVHLI